MLTSFSATTLPDRLRVFSVICAPSICRICLSRVGLQLRMAWSAIKLSSAKRNKLCKEEPSDQLVVGLITSGLLSTSSDPVPSVTKRRHEIMADPRGDLTEDDDLYDELLASANEKKRRLTVDQVKFLEMSFNMDLKLEPERKAMIAKRLGIRPRQVAIWFQNRRARWKNKQLEQDFEALKVSYNALMRENESMVKKNEAIDEENKRLQEEVAQLTSILKSRNGPCYMDARGVKIVLDSESDSDSALKAMEQLSSELELVSPGKTDVQIEMLDTENLSHPTSGEAIVAFVDQTFGERSSLIACAAFKFEADYRIFSPSEDVFFNFPQSVNGFNIDDFLYEDCSFGFRWNG